MRVSLNWIFLLLIITILFYFGSRGFHILESYTNPEIKEGFTISPSSIDTNGISITTCPHSLTKYVNNNSKSMCCDGVVENGVCLGTDKCTLSETDSGMPSCSAWLANELRVKGETRCPPSMPNYFEDLSDPNKPRGCTAGRLNATGTGPQDRSVKFCRRYAKESDEMMNNDSCTNQKMLEDTRCFSASMAGTDTTKALVRWRADLPPYVQCSYTNPTTKMRKSCAEDKTTFATHEFAVKKGIIGGTWKDNYPIYDKINWCSKQKMVEFDGLPFEDLQYVSMDPGSIEVKRPINQCDNTLPSSFTPQQNKLLLDGFNVTENFSLSFVITPTQKLQNQWGNIVQFTASGDDGKFGDRAPGIWFFPNSTRLHVRIGCTEAWNWGMDGRNEIPLNQPTQVFLECKGNQIKLTIGQDMQTATQPGKRYVGKTMVYATSRHHAPAKASITNMCYKRF